MPLKQPGSVDAWMCREPGVNGMDVIAGCDAQGRCVCVKGKEVWGPSLMGLPYIRDTARGAGQGGRGAFQKGAGLSKGKGDSEVREDKAHKSRGILRTV